MPITDPKVFYRKLDDLLSRIAGGGDRTEVLSSVLHQLVESFGPDLSISNGRLYEVVDSKLVLRVDLNSPQNVEGTEISLDYPPVKLLFEHRGYIFDSTTPGIDPDFEQEILGGTESAAIMVGRERVAVLAFGLAPGWEREQIEFALNTIRHFLNHRFDTEGLEEDLEETRLIQRSLFPRRLPEFPGYEFAGKSISADDVGGDFYDFIMTAEEFMGFALGDASGHGLPAALLVRDVVTGLRMGIDKDTKISPTIARLNRVIHRSNLSTKFVSMFYGELEANGNLMYVNAGHVPPFVMMDRGWFRLEVGGSVLGPLPELKFKRGYIHLDRGSLMVTVSDGILERLSPNGEMFGEEPIPEIMKELRDAPAQIVLETIFERAYMFGGEGKWEDDATVLVIRRLA